MKYLIFLIGLSIIVLRTIGINIDILSVGLFSIISFLLLVKNFDNISEFSGFGIKIKINKNLESLSSKVERVENKLMATDKKEEGLSGIPDNNEMGTNGKFYNKDNSAYLERFKPNMQNPKLALIETAIEIERILKIISRQNLEIESKFPISPKIIIDQLYNKGIIDKDLYDTFLDFWKLRNKLVHGINQTYNENQIISLLESGLRILSVLKFIDNNIIKGVRNVIIN